MAATSRQSKIWVRVTKLLVALVALLAVLFFSVTWLQSHKWGRTLVSAGQTDPAPRPAPTTNGAIGCLGSIEPRDGVTQVTAPYFQGRSQRVVDLKVRRGDHVRKGQLLAVLDSKQQLESAARLASARVDLAQSRLNQVKAGANPADIDAQKALIAEIQTSLDNSRAVYRRFELLRQKTDVSAAELDARRLVVETNEHKLKEAQARLESISMVRPSNIDVAQSELTVATAERDRVALDLQTAMVYSPASGTVLNIHAYPGEEAGPRGLLELAKTDAMYIEAEVYESDIARVRSGQRATATSDLFSGSTTGVVETVGSTISKASVLPGDPVAFADARVFKVWIKLNEPERVAGLIHGKVNVVIQP